MTPCPFSAPPPRLLRPRFLEQSPVEDAKTIEWLFKSLDVEIPPASPLARWVRTLRSGGEERTSLSNDQTKAAEPNHDAEVRAAIADLYGAQTLAWSIRVLLAERNAPLISVDGSVFRQELLGVHASETTITMPAATTTLYQSARLHQAAGGKLHVCGKKSEGADIIWEPELGGRVVIERKDRAFEAAAVDDEARWQGFLSKKLATAAPKLSEHGDGVRVMSFGFVGSPERTAIAQQEWRRTIVPLASALTEGQAPHAVYGSFVGYGVAGQMIDAVDRGHFLELIRGGTPTPPHWANVTQAFRMAYDPRFRRDGYAIPCLEQV